MSEMSVRFVIDFEIDIEETVLDEEKNEIKIIKTKHIINRGNIYPLDHRNVRGKEIDLYFSEKGPIKGTAIGVPSDFCEFLLPGSSSKKLTTPQKTKKCGGCG